MKLSGEEGMTLIEVVVAAFCIVLFIGAAAMLYVSGNESSLAGQRNTQLVAIADQQIEAVRQQVKTAGFSALAMKSAPATGTSSTLYSAAVHTDPNDFVSSASGCGSAGLAYTIESNWDDTTAGSPSGLTSWGNCPAGSEPLVVNATNGFVTPQQTVTVGSGTATGTATVDTYVTDTYVGCSSSLGSCSSATGDARRVIVAVEMNNGGAENTGAGAKLREGQNTPYYVTTIFTNPVPSNQVNSSIGLTLGAQLG